MSRKGKQYQLWAGLVLALITTVLLVIVVLNAMKGQTTEVKVDGASKVTGLVCKEKELIHPAFESVPMISHSSTMTANFKNDRLSAISLIYEATYDSEKRAEEGKSFGLADYALILQRKYGENADIFSYSFSVDGAKLQLAQTAREVNKINTNTVTYFLLDQGTSIAKSLEGLKKQYEAKGFSCEISE